MVNGEAEFKMKKEAFKAIKKELKSKNNNL